MGARLLDALANEDGDAARQARDEMWESVYQLHKRLYELDAIWNDLMPQVATNQELGDEHGSDSYWRCRLWRNCASPSHAKSHGVCRTFLRLLPYVMCRPAQRTMWDRSLACPTSLPTTVNCCKSDIDAVLLCQSDPKTEVAVAAFDAGKHVLIEKPMCFSTQEVDSIVAAQERAGYGWAGSLYEGI